MASDYSTKIAEGFSQRILKEMYDRNLADSIVNRDYEGEINGVGSKLNILNFDRITEKTYANTTMSADSLYEANSTLTIDTYKSFYWKEKTLARWLSYIKNPHATIVQQKADERSKNIDEFILGAYADVGAGNWVGVDETTGTVTIDAAGTVTGSGCAFTANMVGKPFKATGHTQWYRVATRSGADAITIEDDLDDVTAAYTGGAISSSAAYTIQASTVLTLTTANVLGYVAAMKLKLDTAERLDLNAVPDTDRFLVVPPEFEDIIVRATGVALHVPDVYADLVQKGYIGSLLGFKLFRSNRLTGDNTDGFHIIGGHKNWMTFAEKQLEATIEEDLIGDFGSAYKDLFVYGKKVTDARRHFATVMFAKFTL